MHCPNRLMALGVAVVSVALSAGAYEPIGQIDWVHHCGFIARDASQDMCGTADGSFYITGWFEDIYEYDAPNIIAPKKFGRRDIFLSKYDSEGELLWIQTAGSGNCDVSGAVDTLPDGTCAITGGYGYGTASATFGFGQANQTVLQGIGHYDVCVAKYDRDGNLAWAVRAGGPEPDFGEDISLTSDGAVYVTGEFKPSITFAPGLPNEFTLTSTDPEHYDYFLARYDADGGFQWAKREHASEVVALTDGGCMISTSPGLCRFSADGTKLWSIEADPPWSGSIAAMPGNDFVGIDCPPTGMRITRFHAQPDGTVTQVWSVTSPGTFFFTGSPISVRPDGVITFCPYGQVGSIAGDGSWLRMNDWDVYWPEGIFALPDSPYCYVTEPFYEDVTVGGVTLEHRGDGDFYFARASNIERYQVTARSTGGPGWVEFDSPDGLYCIGETASCTAVPVFPGVFEFLEWGGSHAGVTDPTLSFPVGEDTQLTAVFEHVEGAPELPATGLAGLAALAAALGAAGFKKQR